MLSEVGWCTTTTPDYCSALNTARVERLDAVIIAQPIDNEQDDDQQQAYKSLLRLIDAQRIATIVIADEIHDTGQNPSSTIDMVNRDVSVSELRGRLAMIGRYQAHFQRLEEELQNMERLGKRLNEHFREVDQEMRLASRLQRDFLPESREAIRNAQFATVYRPASWVSGDIFDIFRIDEDHTGFYVADAVGHGMAASLLTMFIKRTIVSKRVIGEEYSILSPSETISILNNALADQSLPNAQFVTACYVVFNHRTLTLQYARGGHPYPILATTDGMITDLKTPGGLLGLFKGGDFPTFETQLQPGDKLLLFSDGVELAFQSEKSEHLDTTAYHRAFESLARLPIKEMVREIDAPP